VPESALEELVDEAVATVVMMRRRIVSDEHLLGAFWKTLGILVYRQREGRHRRRVGSRTPADFDLVARRATGGEELSEDAIQDSDGDYFIGSMVVHPLSKSSDTVAVVDGQQRLTTLLMFLYAVRDAADERGVDDAW
jgi:hypothetical protein